MKWFRKKKAFEPADLEESTEYPANPDCGWYEIYTFQIENSIDPEELKWSLHEEERLALVLLDIGTYRNTALGEAELEHLRQILRFFAQYKKGVIFRPVYDTQGKGMEREPDHLEQVLQHLGQSCRRSPDRRRCGRGSGQHLCLAGTSGRKLGRNAPFQISYGG